MLITEDAKFLGENVCRVSVYGELLFSNPSLLSHICELMSDVPVWLH